MHHVRVVGRISGPGECTVSLSTVCQRNFRLAAMPTYPLLIRMKLARSEHICVHIALCTFTKVLVLFQNLPVEVADVGKLFIWSIFMAVNFIFDFAGRRRGWHHALDVEEVITPKTSAPFYPNASSIDSRASHRGDWIAEGYCSSKLVIARLFVEDIVSHLRSRRLHSVLVEVRDPSNLTPIVIRNSSPAISISANNDWP
jgi:hypothetical protein